MKWNEIRIKHPDRWVVVEALGAHTSADGRRIIDDMVLVEECDSGMRAFQVYREYHAAHPVREYYYLHTSREELEIVEQRWLGARIPLATNS